jgi:hypothetical protein
MTDASRCGYRWELADPNGDDVRMGVAHSCIRKEGHTDDHRCGCGATPDDDETNHG